MERADGTADGDYRVDSLRRSAERSFRSAWLSPDVLILVALVATTAAWGTRARLVSGVGLGIAGSAIQATLWVSAYLALGRVYCATGVEDGAFGRRLLRRLGCALLLAFISAAIAKYLIEPLLAPLSWNDLRYLRQLLCPLFVGVWCIALLPQQTYQLFRAAETSPAIAPFPQLALLLASAAVLVSCGDMAFQFLDWSGGVFVLETDLITASAWATNTLILFSAFALVFAVTAKVGTALLVVGPLYAAFGMVNLAKLHYIHLPVQPLDLILIPELLPLLPKFFGSEVLLGTIVAVAIWIGVLVVMGRLSACRISRARRAVTGLLSLAVLLAFPAAFSAAPSVTSVKSALQLVGAPVGQRDQSRRHGLLLTFLSNLPAARISAPPGYGAAAVIDTLNRYSTSDAPGEARQQGEANLIVYLVESLMDPDDLGFRFTADPIPNLRALRETHGIRYGIVPGQFGGSANTEFEVLTGMTMALLPGGSVPYKRYLWRRIPSLASTLRDLGYATVAIQADPKYYFNRERAYDLLGFDRVVWLHEERDAERDARGFGLPSDAAVVQALIEVSRERHPFFAFAFPTSTHAPYNSGTYRNSDLDVVDGSPVGSVAEIKEYVNSLRVADQAVGTFIRYFRDRPERTIVVVLGDHLPPLSQNALQRFFTRSSRLPQGAQALMTRRVPLLVWANFEMPTDQGELSTNALPAYLLEKMNIVPTNLLAVTAAVRRRMPVFGPYLPRSGGRDLETGRVARCSARNDRCVPSPSVRLVVRQTGPRSAPMGVRGVGPYVKGTI